MPHCSNRRQPTVSTNEKLSGATATSSFITVGYETEKPMLNMLYVEYSNIRIYSGSAQFGTDRVWSGTPGKVTM